MYVEVFAFYGFPVQPWIDRVFRKIERNLDEILLWEEDGIEDALVVVMAYGITARVTRMGIDLARKKGVKVGFIRLVVVWPFPEKRVRELSTQVKAIVVPEINYGQIVLEVERCAAGNCAAICVPHGGGTVHDPKVICDAIVRAAK